MDASQFGGARKMTARVDAINVETGEQMVVEVAVYMEADGTEITDPARIAEVEAWQANYLKEQEEHHADT